MGRGTDMKNALLLMLGTLSLPGFLASRGVVSAVVEEQEEGPAAAEEASAKGTSWLCYLLLAGGERILDVFEIKLKEAIQKLPFQKILTLKNVQNVVNEADG
jgi:hypothetical protein